eukprot:857921_1
MKHNQMHEHQSNNDQNKDTMDGRRSNDSSGCNMLTVASWLLYFGCVILCIAFCLIILQTPYPTPFPTPYPTPYPRYSSIHPKVPTENSRTLQWQWHDTGNWYDYDQTVNAQINQLSIGQSYQYDTRGSTYKIHRNSIPTATQTNTNTHTQRNVRGLFTLIPILANSSCSNETVIIP